MKQTLSLLAAALLAAATARAASITYQGALRNVSGQALTGNQTIEFRLYEQATGGTALWGRACSVLLDANGLFNTELGDDTGSALSGVSPSKTLARIVSENAGKPLYVGVTVADTSGEIAPRQRILSVPYALYADDVTSASGDFAAAGRVTATALTVSGDAAVKGALSVTKTLSVDGSLGVAGTITGYGTVPVGTIVLWSGAANRIPDGWALCNGQTLNGNKTPDLRNRFVVGAGSTYAVGNTGGADAVTLSVAQMPSHRHSYTFKGADLAASWKDNNYFYNQSQTYSGNNNTQYTDYTGGGQPHENRPPYYALCYIMRVK